MSINAHSPWRRLAFAQPFCLALMLSVAAVPVAAGKAHLPPPRTPARLMKPTPPPAAARAEIHGFRQYLPKAFYDSPNFPEKYHSLLFLRAKDEWEKEQGYRFAKIIRGDPKKKMVALTFDDGPHEKYTLELLNILHQTQTPATFFVVGRQMEKFPTLVQLEVIEGHEVGNHTYDHVNLTQIPPELIGYELDECDRMIKRLTGSSVRFFRPPGGDYDGDVIRAAAQRHYVITLWTDDPGDYSGISGPLILQRALERLEPGAILLLHDGMPETLKILPALIAEARSRGYQFVTISQLAAGREKWDKGGAMTATTKVHASARLPLR